MSAQLAFGYVAFFVVEQILFTTFATNFLRPLVHQVVGELFIAATFVRNADDIPGFVVCKVGCVLLAGCVVNNRFGNQSVYGIIIALDFTAIRELYLYDVQKTVQSLN